MREQSLKNEKISLKSEILIKTSELLAQVDGNFLFFKVVSSSLLALLADCFRNHSPLSGNSSKPHFVTSTHGDPSFPSKLAFCGSPIWLETKIKKTPYLNGVLQVDGNFLSSQVVSNQILSAFESLTFVFGMGTSGTSQLLSPSWFIEHQFSLI